MDRTRPEEDHRELPFQQGELDGPAGVTLDLSDHVGKPVREGEDVLEPPERSPRLGAAEVSSPPAHLGGRRRALEAIPVGLPSHDAVGDGPVERGLESRCEVVGLCLEDPPGSPSRLRPELSRVADFEQPTSQSGRVDRTFVEGLATQPGNLAILWI